MRPDQGPAGAGAEQSGFTLLEVIVAFAISALAVALLYQGTTGGLGATETASKTTEAVLLARSHLAAIGHGAAIAPQDSNGVDGDGYTWHLRIRPIATREMNLSDSDRANDTKPTNAVLYEILVTESWQDGRRTRAVALTTRRFELKTADAG
jgi:general secretion pathway protein I